MNETSSIRDQPAVLRRPRESVHMARLDQLAEAIAFETDRCDPRGLVRFRRGGCDRSPRDDIVLNRAARPAEQIELVGNV